MNAERHLFAALVLCTTLGASAGAAAQTSDAAGLAPSFDAAMVDYQRQHFAAAFDALSRLADAGHAEAARVALLMHANGPRLYGQRFDAAPQRRTAWLDAASTGASPSLASRWGALLGSEKSGGAVTPPAPH
jgi:hypothetical protein